MTEGQLSAQTDCRAQLQLAQVLLNPCFRLRLYHSAAALHPTSPCSRGSILSALRFHRMSRSAAANAIPLPVPPHRSRPSSYFTAFHRLITSGIASPPSSPPGTPSSRQIYGATARAPSPTSPSPLSRPQRNPLPPGAMTCGPSPKATWP